MIAIQQNIFETLSAHAALTAIVGSRIYPDIAPQKVSPYYVVWQQINEDQAKDLSGTSETNSLNNYQIQITSWAEKATAVRDMDKAVRNAMNGATAFRSLVQNSRSLPYEPDTKLFGAQTDFSVWLKT